MKIVVLLPKHPVDTPQLLYRSLNMLLCSGAEVYCYSPEPCYSRFVSQLLEYHKVPVYRILGEEDYKLLVAFDIDTIQSLGSLSLISALPCLLISSGVTLSLGRPALVDAWLRDVTELSIPPYLDIETWTYHAHFGSFPLVASGTVPKPKDKRRILVAGGRELLYRLAPWLNTLIDVDVLVLWDGGIEPLFNQHIQVRPVCLETLEADVQSSDIVIASGFAVELALLTQKLAIVVGQKGFGGLITDQNLVAQHTSGYAGRVGGLLDEYVPIQLVVHAYEQAEQILQAQSEMPSRLASVVQSIQDKQVKGLQEQIEKIVQSISLRRGKVENKVLQLSPSYKLLGFSEERYTLTHQPSGRVYGQLGAEEASIIKLFNDKTKVSEALMKSDYRTEPMEFLSFVQLLVSEYILIPQS